MRPEPSGGLSSWARIRLATEILVAYAWIYRAMRREELESIVARLRAGGDAADGGMTRTARFHLAGAVGRVLSVLPTDSRCLVRSLVLLALLERRGVAGTLVIGVRTEPEFGAHSWVEYEGEALLTSGGGEFARLTSL